MHTGYLGSMFVAKSLCWLLLLVILESFDCTVPSAHTSVAHAARWSGDGHNLSSAECVIVVQRLHVGFNRFEGLFDYLLGALGILVSVSAESNMLSGSLPTQMASLGLQVGPQDGN